MAPSIPLTFLGTGNAFAPGRDWNSFVIGGRVLVETAPTVLPNLRAAGIDPTAIDAIFLSHFHADHTFGWPFLLLEYLLRSRRRSDLWVVGPPGVEHRLNEMVRIGSYAPHSRERGGFDLHFVEVDEQPQQAGPVSFRAVRVEHEPNLDCYGFVVEHDGRTVGYSGDTRLCDGLRRIASMSDALVLECAVHEGSSPIHMNLADVGTLRQEYAHLPMILTHLDTGMERAMLPGVRLACDLETIDV